MPFHRRKDEKSKKEEERKWIYQKQSSEESLGLLGEKETGALMLRRYVKIRSVFFWLRKRENLGKEILMAK